MSQSAPATDDSPEALESHIHRVQSELDLTLVCQRRHQLAQRFGDPGPAPIRADLAQQIVADLDYLASVFRGYVRQAGRGG